MPRECVFGGVGLFPSSLFLVLLSIASLQATWYNDYVRRQRIQTRFRIQTATLIVARLVENKLTFNTVLYVRFPTLIFYPDVNLDFGQADSTLNPNPLYREFKR